MRRNASRLCQHLSAFDILAFGAAQEDSDIVAGLPFIKQLAEHFDARRDRLLSGFKTDDFNFLADFDDTALDTTGNDGAATANRKNIFDGHNERLINFANRFLNEGIDCVHEL